MFELPIFPLQTVLFPGAPIHLHIFEERYQRMIRMCAQTGRPFGVTLIRRGVEALGPLAEPYSIGCTALINQVQHLGEGRMNIVALGQDRFRIQSLNSAAFPYLVADADYFPLLNPDPHYVTHASAALLARLRRYFQILVEAGKLQFDLDSLPEEPVALAYLAASHLQAQPAEKQALLSLETASELLARLNTIYQRELALLKLTLSAGIAPRGSFSNN